MDVKLTGTVSYPRDTRWMTMLTGPNQTQTQTQDLFIGTELSQLSKAFSFSPHTYIQGTLMEISPCARPVPRAVADTKMTKVQQATPQK